MSKELFDAVQMLAQEKGIRRITCMKKFLPPSWWLPSHDYNGRTVCDIDPEKQRFKVYVTKNVVEEVEDRTRI